MDNRQIARHSRPVQSPAGTVANVVAWALLLGLTGVAGGMVVILGPFGLILLGLIVLFICTSLSLREDAPTWGTAVFKAQMSGPRSPEQQAADAAEKHSLLSSLRFYRWCGIVLVAAGAAGFAWQQWH
jgi:hypothetical protein